MEQNGEGHGESRVAEGGSVPGVRGAAAFRLTAPHPSPIPVLIAVPHAGRAYPDSLLERMRNPGWAALRLEDRYVDLLGQRVAQQTGAALLVAQAPRAMIDLNRAADDIDWGMVNGGGDHAELEDSYSPAMHVRRASSGLGLIPRRLPGIGELWKRRHDEAELAARIGQIHKPYHDCLATALAGLRARWGAALLIDLHSMPPLLRQGGRMPPEFVVGDRFGAACGGALVASAFGYFAEMRRLAAHNRPYAGGYVLDRHADPQGGVHAMQLEIDRSSYLDSRLAEPGKGLAAMVHLLTGLVRRLAGDVAELARERRGDDGQGGWAEAAE